MLPAPVVAADTVKGRHASMLSHHTRGSAPEVVQRLAPTLWRFSLTGSRLMGDTRVVWAELDCFMLAQRMERYVRVGCYGRSSLRWGPGVWMMEATGCLQELAVCLNDIEAVT